MAHGNGYIFAFATGVCLVCSLGLAVASQSLKERQQTNIRRDFQKNVLEALGLPDDGTKPTGEQIDTLYAERVKLVVIDGSGTVQEGKSKDDVEAARAAVKGTDDPAALMPVYQRVDDGSVVNYAIETRGVGLWGPISGFLALAPDGYTVTGATFFAPKETPGLGGNITLKDKFRDQWTGKRIHDGSEPRGISVKKPGTTAGLCPGAEIAYCVDGVSGATITGDGVDEMVAEAVVSYEPYLTHIRSGGGS